MMNIRTNSATTETTIIIRLSTPKEMPPMLMLLEKRVGKFRGVPSMAAITKFSRKIDAPMAEMMKYSEGAWRLRRGE